MTPKSRLMLVGPALLVFSVGSHARPAGGPVAAELDARRFAAEYGRPQTIPSPADNVATSERLTLGRSLFFDPRLSRSNFVSCASCHNPAFSWGDGNARATGDNMKTLGRRTPTILNLAWAEALFWDGRAATLEEQALGPITSAAEMNLPVEQLVSKVSGVREYVRMFERAYPGEGVTPGTIGKAIAVFERSVVSGTAPFDRWVAGEASALSDEAKRGFVLFNTKARCAQCHTGWRFTDDGFQDIGLPGEDRGRGAIVKLDEAQYSFKTPTLRNVTHRGPYMHDGSVATLAEVVELYDRGGDVRRPSISAEIHPLHLTAAEKRALLAFMQTLSGEDAAVSIPTLPR
jgi:cytochrome c peroxidase